MKEKEQVMDLRIEENEILCTHTHDDSCWNPPLPSFPARSFSRRDPGRTNLGDYRINWQRPAWPRTSISGRGRSQTCQRFQSSWNASQPLISHKYQKEAAEFSVGLLCNVGLTMWTHTNYPSSCIRMMSHAAVGRFQVSPLAYRTGTRQKAHVDSYVCPHSNK